MDLLPVLTYLASFILGALIVLILFRNKTSSLEERNIRLQALHKLDEIMMSSYENLMEVAQRVTDAVAFEIKLGLGILALIDDKSGLLNRVAMSRTSRGNLAKQVLPFPYEQLSIPLNYSQNLMIKAIQEQKLQVTRNLHDVFVPVLDEKISRDIQVAVGVKTSLVYPVKARGKVIGVMIISLSRENEDLKSYESETIKDLIDVVGIALDNAMLYQNLKTAGAELQEANSKLKELDRLKDDFVSVASHELRTPMAAIRSYVWMALNRSDVPLSAKLKKYLERTFVSTERLINLVNGMLNVSRIESGKIEINPHVFDIQSLVSDVMSEVELKAQEKVLSIRVAYSSLPKVFADKDKVHQVLLNLLGNAIKFTPREGIIQISFVSDGDFVEVLIKDSGVGISKEDLTRLFQKFGRLDNSYTAAATSGGTGLGLYICKSLIELMKGKIWAVSDGIGKGATFSFSLPVANAQTVSEPEKYSTKPIGDGRGLETVAI